MQKTKKKEDLGPLPYFTNIFFAFIVNFLCSFCRQSTGEHLHEHFPVRTAADDANAHFGIICI
ncbi:MAG: hypothetical protein A4E54_02839 [Pelotomaculum sp. PtaB.Bin117]|nr:MAG: hypothetical protein A4E54_02839 [Pelotomaculum sp. PtaB.Bin117]OPY63304.1 MAG: hypothetical protein A4E56_00654 [Pelotomaculum sp. PtaU1.Bin065]